MPLDATRLGNAMYEAMMAIQMDQNSNAGEDIGRRRMIAIATEIVGEIQQNATIMPLTTLEAPMAPGPHVHSTTTQPATGKIN